MGLCLSHETNCNSIREAFGAVLVFFRPLPIMFSLFFSNSQSQIAPFLTLLSLPELSGRAAENSLAPGEMMGKGQVHVIYTEFVVLVDFN